MAEIKLFGYTNKLSVKPGENIDFHVSADGTKSADAQLVRIIHGDEHPNGPGYMDEEIESDLNGKWDGKQLILDEKFNWSDGEVQKRQWKINKINEQLKNYRDCQRKFEAYKAKVKMQSEAGMMTTD